MATYPVKMLKDEEGKPFVPLISIDSIKEVGGETLEEKLDNKLEVTNLIAGTQIELEVDGNNITINNSAEGTKLINNLDQASAGVGALDAAQGKVLKDSIPKIANNLTTIDSTQALSAHQGYVLAGRSIPVGGGNGQVLMKSADDDYSVTWGDAADPNAIIGDGSIKKIVELTYNEYIALEEAGQLEDTTEYHISDWNENERTYMTTQDIVDLMSAKLDLKDGVTLVAGQDLNTIITPGTYRSNNATITSALLNAPKNVSSGFMMIVFRDRSSNDSTGYYRQELKYGRATLIRRTIDKGETWTDWEIIPTYSVGDVFITSINDNPGGRLGGTWTMFEKELSSLSVLANDAFTITDDNIKNLNFYYTRSQRTIMINMSFTNNVEINDTQITLGTIDFAKIGITRTLANIRGIGYSDGGEGLLMMYIGNTTGELSVVDVVSHTNANVIPAGSTIYFTVTFNVPGSYCVEDKCDKFYWRRTG